MCGRTSLYVDLGVLEERFDATAAFDYEPRYNIAPRQDLAPIRNTSGEEIVAQNWGLLAPWADDPDDGPRPINARAETVTEKRMFREPMAERRSFMLADGFYEWKGERCHKQPFRVCLEDNSPFAFAGLWNRWEHNGDSLETVTITTTEPNEVVELIRDRMPVILEPDHENEWFPAEPKRARELLDPYQGEDLRAYPVWKLVNDPANDTPEVLVEVDDQQQSGLGEFGA